MRFSIYFLVVLVGNPHVVETVMGVILATGSNIDEAKSKAQEAKSLISVKLK